MIRTLFSTVIYDPLYNGLVFLVDVLPGNDLGLAIIALTILVRVLIFPLSKRAVESQQALRTIAPEIEALKKKYPPNSPEQARAIFALYKERNIHPFAGVGVALVQIPVLLGLYLVFAHGGLPTVDAARLYSFVSVPSAVDTWFLGFVDVNASRNLVLAVLAAGAQFAQMRLSLGPVKEHVAESSFSGDLARSLDLQARYMLPAIIAVFSYSLVAAVSLYWVTASLFMIAQEYAGGRRFRLNEA